VAYKCLTEGTGHAAKSVLSAMQESYVKNITDEFIEPTYVANAAGKPIALVQDGDSVIFFNFRGDRPRELTRAFVDADFSGFARHIQPKTAKYVCMTEYDSKIQTPVAFPPIRKMPNIAGEYLSNL